MLLPMYFLIGIWGGPRKEYAAIKFFLYTLAGSVFMLLAMLAMYYTSTAVRSDGTPAATPSTCSSWPTPAWPADLHRLSCR